MESMMTIEKSFLTSRLLETYNVLTAADAYMNNDAYYQPHRGT